LTSGNEEKEFIEPAFPTKGSAHEFTGLTIRDWFAGQALASMAVEDAATEPDVVAAYVYEVADAMLKERDK